MNEPAHPHRSTALLVLSIVALVVGAAPLAVYPFVVLANLMSLVAEPNPDATAHAVTLSRIFFALSTAYPLAWILGLAGCIHHRVRRRVVAAVAWSLVPPGYVGITTLAWGLWTLS